MPPSNRDAAYLWDMREAAQEIVSLLQGIELESYASSKHPRLSVERLFITIGEAANRVSSSFQAIHAEIPWAEMIGLRNVVVHDYDDIRDEVLFETAGTDLPKLITSLDTLISDAMNEL